ncbi:LytR/AlgR family response regulator transcription factor [Anaerostipes sp.]|uniref:LytR/AlgR family response regulator transcription factor n=1 Tax=Anaerostipes sp. TaxID=1872530 RepID=UPI0025C039F9|nr:LytTR family DNA-binding domain-containing protein [Anaerostipes sp.]MBS7008499.1 response regulator transcription factor [Anaerostipes sp.]
MRVALIDDETEYLHRMTEYCNEFYKQKNLQLDLSVFHSGESFLDSFQKSSYAIVFMDIYMKGMGGIEAAQNLRKKDSECILIFLTSSPDFMPDAFSCHAFEYITKPFTKDRVFQVLEDVLRIMPPVSRFIEILSERKKVPILLSDVMSVISDGHYLEITLADNSSLRSRMTAGNFLNLTDNDPRFLSVNKGVILNADYINRIENHCCTLENGAKFPIRVRKRRQIEEEVRNYHFKKIRSRQKYSSEQPK